jgi:hypothetical protein
VPELSADLALVLGLLWAALAIPNLISAFSAGEPPRLAIVFIVLSGAFLAYAALNKPGGYTAAEIPGVVGSVIGGFFR